MTGTIDSCRCISRIVHVSSLILQGKLLASFQVVILCILLLNSGTGSEALGVPVYSQVIPHTPAGAFTSMDRPDSQKIADSFRIQGTDPITIRSLRFIGGYGVTSPPPPTPPLDQLPADAFKIVFLSDEDGRPGSPIPNGEFTNLSVFSRQTTNRRRLNGLYDPVIYTIALDHEISLMPNEEHWISITNNSGQDHFWLWARSGGGSDLKIASTRDAVDIGPWDTFNNGGMWFSLNNSTPIPEPSTIVFCLSLGGVLLNLRPGTFSYRSQNGVFMECRANSTPR